MYLDVFRVALLMFHNLWFQYCARHCRCCRIRAWNLCCAHYKQLTFCSSSAGFSGWMRSRMRRDFVRTVCKTITETGDGRAYRAVHYYPTLFFTAVLLIAFLCFSYVVLIPCCSLFCVVFFAFSLQPRGGWSGYRVWNRSAASATAGFCSRI